MKDLEIINFIVSQDIYYYNDNYKNNENRDPDIFNHIPITDEHKNYLANIQLIKRYKIWNIFSESHTNFRQKFHQVLLHQMKKVRDLKSIFDIFKIKNFEQDFTFLINAKIRDLISTIVNISQKFYKVFFEIYDSWLTINNSNNLDLYFCINLIIVNSNLASKYFFYLPTNNKMKVIVNKIKENISNYFLQLNKSGSNNVESLVSLLLLSKGKKIDISLLNELDNKIMKEKDFYTKINRYIYAFQTFLLKL